MVYLKALQSVMYPVMHVMLNINNNLQQHSVGGNSGRLILRSPVHLTGWYEKLAS